MLPSSVRRRRPWPREPATIRSRYSAAALSASPASPESSFPLALSWAGAAPRATSSIRRFRACSTLASSPAAANQAFRTGERAYGVQFHLEVTPAMAREWAEVPADRRSAERTLGREGGEAFLAEIESRAEELHPPARRLFGNWLEL